MNAPDRTLANLRINPDWAKLPLFDRSSWRTMQFGEFAESVNERVEPSDAADEIYVGLEHLDSDNLHLRRWGKGSDVTGTKLRFRKGDIIFGRRRAYQRKLAVAEFDGICSAHAMVVRAIGNDATWNAEYQIQLKAYGPERAHGCELLPTRYGAVAAAMGAHGEDVVSFNEWKNALTRAANAGTVGCVNVLIERHPAPRY